MSYIRSSKAIQLGLTIHPNDQLALLADQQTRMASQGEVDFIVCLGNILLRVRALVMKNLQAECFGGTTFHADNNVEARIRSGTVSIHGRFTVSQSNPMLDMPVFSPHQESQTCIQESHRNLDNKLHSMTRPYANSCQLTAISLPTEQLVFPSDFLNIPVPANLSNVNYLSITPSFPTAYSSSHWQPQICEVLNGMAMFKNTSNVPLHAKQYSHFRPNSVVVTDISSLSTSSSPLSLCSTTQHDLSNRPIQQSPTIDPKDLCSPILVNKSIMSTDQLHLLNSVNAKHCKVFDNDLSEGYNHQAGKFFADFIFVNKPPLTRVFVPQFKKRCSDLLQAKCDELERQGVLVDPKVHNISVVHVSPSWIQQKGRAKHKQLQDCTLDELRFITAFNTLNEFIRPKPSTSCSANTIFKFLARWKYHIYADLNNSYFQLHVKKSLWGYLGIMTPHKGIRVMTRTGQGLLGSDVELEQLICRVLGDHMSEGYCAALRDDIIIGGNSIDEALTNYSLVLEKLHSNNLKLNPSKVRVFPADTEIYGYRIKNGSVLPSDHAVKTLGKAKLEDLITNKQINSWKGLYKTLIGHLPALSNVMAPFDAATSGKGQHEKFVWTPALTSAFNAAMRHLDKINATFLPKPSEQLILLPDAMSVSPCIGWVLYVQRDGKTLPVSYCTAKLKDYMQKWYPCEK